MTRADIEEIRGVATSRGTLDVLLETRLDQDARPASHAGTAGDVRHDRGFLSHFGLDTVGDLPGLEELKAAGLLDSRVPADFTVPEPQASEALAEDEDPLEPGDDGRRSPTIGKSRAG